MGSLMPGWNSALPGLAPAPFRDYNDNEEVPSQLYRKHHGTVPAPRSPPDATRCTSMPALGRRSAPLPGKHASGSHNDTNIPLPKSQSATSRSLGGFHRLSLGRASHEAAIPEEGVPDMSNWWHRLSSSRLNEMAAEEAAAASRKQQSHHYAPQDLSATCERPAFKLSEGWEQYIHGPHDGDAAVVLRVDIPQAKQVDEGAVPPVTATN